jgi:hypothetical protein
MNRFGGNRVMEEIVVLAGPITQRGTHPPRADTPS